LLSGVVLLDGGIDQGLHFLAIDNLRVFAVSSSQEFHLRSAEPNPWANGFLARLKR